MKERQVEHRNSQSTSGRDRMAQQNRQRTEIPDDETINSIIRKGNIEELVEWAETIGRGLAKNEGLKAAGVRKFFGMVRKMEAIEASVETSEPDLLSDETYRELLLLKPKLMYQAQRDRETTRSEAIATLACVLVPAIDAVRQERLSDGQDAKAFRNFADFFEAILAYHKAAGGRDK